MRPATPQQAEREGRENPAADDDAPARALQRIPLWVDLRHVPVNKRLGILHAIDEVAAEHILLSKGDPHLDRTALHPILVDGRNHLKDGSRTVGRIVHVRDAKSQARAASEPGLVVVEADDWRVIPLENLVAARSDRPGTLFARANNPEEVRLFSQVLESGVHGIVLAPQGPADVFLADRALRETYRPPPSPPLTVTQLAEEIGRSATTPAPVAASKPSPAAPGPAPPVAPTVAHATTAPQQTQPSPGMPTLRLEPATVVRIADGGFGERVCVDTTSLLQHGEGLLVGSTARSLALVHAETAEAGYLEPRPFRVNAGAVHSYVLAPHGRTRYLSEMRAGDEVLVVSRDGSTRTATVGRCKVERRPHLLVQWRTADGDAGAILQNAETVRLVRPDGSLVAVTSLRPGDTILVHHESAARHTGLAVAEWMEER